MQFTTIVIKRLENQLVQLPLHHTPGILYWTQVRTIGWPVKFSQPCICEGCQHFTALMSTSIVLLIDKTALVLCSLKYLLSCWNHIFGKHFQVLRPGHTFVRLSTIILKPCPQSSSTTCHIEWSDTKPGNSSICMNLLFLLYCTQ